MGSVKSVPTNLKGNTDDGSRVKSEFVKRFTERPKSDKEMVYLEQLNNSQRAAVLENVGYNDETLREDMERIKLWLKRQMHIPSSAMTEPDCVYEAFLVHSKGNLSLSKNKIDNYYSARGKLPHLFLERDPLNEDVHSSTEIMLMATLPKPTPDGCRVSVVAFTDLDPKLFNFLDCIKRFIFITELRGREEGIWAGEWIVIDSMNLTLAHFLRISPKLFSEIIHFIQHVLPARIKGVVYINAHPFMEKTLNMLVRPVLKKKLLSRIHLYSEGSTALLKHFPKEMLPQDFGGDEEPLKNLSDKWMERAISKRDFFIGPLSEITSEEKRLKINKGIKRK